MAGMNPAEAYQRRIDTGEWKPSVMTEDDRLTWRRWEAGYAFETMPQRTWEARQWTGTT